MKRTILISALVGSLLTASFAFAANNLWEYFGGNLPSLSERSLIYEEAGFSGAYHGTAEQNISLLSYLEENIRLGFLAPPSSTVEGTSTAGWTDDGSNVRLNTASDFVGIGTANPADKLSVVGGNVSVSGDISLSGGDLNIGGVSATSTLTRGTNGLGLGTTSPFTTLSVQGGLFVSGTTTTGVLQATSTLVASTTRFSGGPVFSWPQNAGSANQLLQTDGIGTLSFVSAATTFLGLSDTDQSSFTANRIIHTNSGATGLTDTAGFVFASSKLGIGSTSPAQALSIHESAYISSNLFLGGTLTSTSSLASTIPYASSTAITVSGTASTSNLIVSNTATLPIYATTSASVSTGASTGNTAAINAVCLAGDLAIAGGFTWTSGGNVPGHITTNNPTTVNTTNDSWRIAVITDAANTQTISATAICLNQ